MGNSMSECRSSGKVILSDGAVYDYDKPLTVAELMMEYPQQVVVEFQAMAMTTPSSSERLNPLPADKKLEVDKVYFMVRMKSGRPPSLSSEEARRLLVKANLMLKSKPLLSDSGLFLPLFARTIAASGEFMVGDHSTHRKENLLVEEEKGKVLKQEVFAEILEGRPDYLSRQLSARKGWKPSLDTIKEKTVKPKVPHWLL